MTARIVASLLVLLALVPLAAAQTGPFTGTVRENQTRIHHYDNNPENNLCPQVITTYTVTLTYTPTTDVLTLTAGGQTVTGSNGTAVLTFEGNYCTAFAIRVTGTSVESVATYTVNVSRGGGATA